MDLDDGTLESEDLDKTALELRTETVDPSVDIISVGRIHDELRTGDAGLSTFSGSDSTVLLGFSNLHICADNCDFISDVSRLLSISV